MKTNEDRAPQSRRISQIFYGGKQVCTRPVCSLALDYLLTLRRSSQQYQKLKKTVEGSNRSFVSSSVKQLSLSMR